MKIKTKRIWQALALAIVFAVAARLLWTKHSPPQIITLPNGERFEFVAAEWGTNQIQPTFAARFVARLPAPAANYILRKYGNRLGIVTPVGSGSLLRFGTGGLPFLFPDSEPSLHFWFRSLSTNTTGMPLYRDLKFMLAGKDGVVAGRGSFRWRTHADIADGLWETFGQGTDGWLSFTLPVVPRRSESLQLCLFQADELVGTVQFRNPLFGRFPHWQPEPLPATKTSGDLQVRLTEFSVGVTELWDDFSKAHSSQTHLRPPVPGEVPSVAFKLDIQARRAPNETWLVSHAELSDATGNHLLGGPLSLSPVTGEYSFGPALWPDEGAWRLRLTMRRLRDFGTEELVTFSNVSVPAVGATNIAFMTNYLGGVPVVLKQEFVRKPGRTYVAVEAIDPPDGFVVGFERLIAANGWEPPQSRGSSYSIELYSIPTNVTALDITWAVQKTRTVEFLVKPPKVE